MDVTLTLLDLAGSVALLLWGVHMVQTGVQRAFGARLRRVLGGRAAQPRHAPSWPGSASPPSCKAAPRPA